MNNKAENIFFYCAFIALALVHLLGINLDPMDLDAAQYAQISKEMFLTGKYTELYCNGVDYLDKPPLLFWMNSLSFTVFGVHNWSYRLPSILVLFLGLYAVYQYAKIYYGGMVGKMAVLIAGSCTAAVMMTTDVRTDTMLTGWVMFALWQLAVFNTNKKIIHLMLGAVGIGLAMLTKGLIGLILPVTAFTVEFAYKNEWKKFIQWQYLVAIVVIGLLLLPMCYGLYNQFDLHPEKLVNNQKGVSGIRFFFWTQSFGRITGENMYDNNPDPFFLYHSFLWTFFPWIVFFIPAIYNEIKEKIKNRKNQIKGEAITVGGFVFVFFFLSLSQYQLPHYTFLLHPLAAIIVANYVYKQANKQIANRSFLIVNNVSRFILILPFVVAFILMYIVFPDKLPSYHFLIALAVGLALLTFLYVSFYINVKNNINIILSFLLPMLSLIAVLNLVFYPALFTYQSGSQIGQKVDLQAKHTKNPILVVFNVVVPCSMNYNTTVKCIPFKSEPQLRNEIDSCKRHPYFVCDSIGSIWIKIMYPNAKLLQKFPHYHVANLSLQFLNPATRNKKLSWLWLMEVPNDGYKLKNSNN